MYTRVHSERHGSPGAGTAALRAGGELGPKPGSRVSPPPHLVQPLHLPGAGCTGQRGAGRAGGGGRGAGAAAGIAAPGISGRPEQEGGGARARGRAAASSARLPPAAARGTSPGARGLATARRRLPAQPAARRGQPRRPPEARRGQPSPCARTPLHEDARRWPLGPKYPASKCSLPARGGQAVNGTSSSLWGPRLLRIPSHPLRWGH